MAIYAVCSPNIVDDVAEWDGVTPWTPAGTVVGPLAGGTDVAPGYGWNNSVGAPVFTPIPFVPPPPIAASATLAQSFQLANTEGPILKTDPADGSLQVRDPTDSALVRIQVGAPTGPNDAAPLSTVQGVGGTTIGTQTFTIPPLAGWTTTGGTLSTTSRTVTFLDGSHGGDNIKEAYFAHGLNLAQSYYLQARCSFFGTPNFGYVGIGFRYGAGTTWYVGGGRALLTFSINGTGNAYTGAATTGTVDANFLPWIRVSVSTAANKPFAGMAAGNCYVEFSMTGDAGDWITWDNRTVLAMFGAGNNPDQIVMVANANSAFASMITLASLTYANVP